MNRGTDATNEEIPVDKDDWRGEDKLDDRRKQASRKRIRQGQAEHPSHGNPADRNRQEQRDKKAAPQGAGLLLGNGIPLVQNRFPTLEKRLVAGLLDCRNNPLPGQVVRGLDCHGVAQQINLDTGDAAQGGNCPVHMPLAYDTMHPFNCKVKNLHILRKTKNVQLAQNILWRPGEPRHPPNVIHEASASSGQQEKHWEGAALTCLHNYLAIRQL